MKTLPRSLIDAGFLAISVAATALLLTPETPGQVEHARAEGFVPVSEAAPAQVDPRSRSCNDLKVQMRSSGQLNLLSGPGPGSGDTFYGPAVPRCQFWQMPQFAYVRARDGLCGVGYICVDKYSMD
jgi:hypothetical protein